jgi:hypothetical protein
MSLLLLVAVVWQRGHTGSKPSSGKIQLEGVRQFETSVSPAAETDVHPMEWRKTQWEA